MFANSKEMNSSIACFNDPKQFLLKNTFGTFIAKTSVHAKPLF